LEAEWAEVLVKVSEVRLVAQLVELMEMEKVTELVYELVQK
jgi:hypothetical protein